MLPSLEHPGPAETARILTRNQRDTLRAIAFFRRQRKAGSGWLVSDKRLSEKMIERLEVMELVEESFIGGRPTLQLTIVGRAIEAKLQGRLTNARTLPPRAILGLRPRTSSDHPPRPQGDDARSATTTTSVVAAKINFFDAETIHQRHQVRAQSRLLTRA